MRTSIMPNRLWFDTDSNWSRAHDGSTTDIGGTFHRHVESKKRSTPGHGTRPRGVRCNSSTNL
jgi:hypothetical protein